MSSLYQENTIICSWGVKPSGSKPDLADVRFSQCSYPNSCVCVTAPSPSCSHVVCLVWSPCRWGWGEIQLMSSCCSYFPTLPTHCPCLPCMENQLVNHWPSRESPVCSYWIIHWSSLLLEYYHLLKLTAAFFTLAQCLCPLQENWGYAMLPTAAWGLFGTLLLVVFASITSHTSLMREKLRR